MFKEINFKYAQYLISLPFFIGLYKAEQIIGFCGSFPFIWANN